MGIYLSSPKTEKSLDRGENGNVKWVAMGMQGKKIKFKDGEPKWRIAISLKPTFRMMSLFSEFSTATEAPKSPFTLKNILYLL
jgi:hypothetical protein